MSLVLKEKRIAYSKQNFKKSARNSTTRDKITVINKVRCLPFVLRHFHTHDCMTARASCSPIPAIVIPNVLLTGPYPAGSNSRKYRQWRHHQNEERERVSDSVRVVIVDHSPMILMTSWLKWARWRVLPGRGVRQRARDVQPLTLTFCCTAYITSISNVIIIIIIITVITTIISNAVSK